MSVSYLTNFTHIAARLMMFVMQIPAWKWVDGDWRPAVAEQDGSATSSQLSIVTFNIWFDSFERKTRCHGLGELLGALTPDIIALQEATLRMLQPLLECDWVRRSYWCSASAFSPPATHGVVILSRRAVPELRLIQLPGAMGRRLLIADFPELRLGVVHLESQAPNSTMRVQQMGVAWREMAEAASSLVVGDFNFSDGAPESEMIPVDYTDLWPRLYPDSPGWTLDTERNGMLLKQGRRARQQRFDRMLLRSDAWRPRGLRLLGDQALQNGASPVFCSDHFGLHLVLERG